MSLNTQIDNIVKQLFDGTLVSGLDLTRSATYRKSTPGSMNFSTGQLQESYVDVSIKLIARQFNTSEVAKSDGRIRTNDCEFMLRPLTGVELEDMQDDTIILDSKNYRVKSAEKRSLGDKDLVFVIHGEAL
jgi:hypothetical protein